MDELDRPPVTGVSERKEGDRKGGRPEYKPSDDERALVKQLVGEGVVRSTIAKRLGVSPVTMRKHFAPELGRDAAAAAPDLLSFDGAAPPAKPALGRPAFEPNYRQRDDVRLLKADDWSDERIARYIGISRNTLLEHFAEELEDGADRVRAQVLRDLKLASSKGNSAAADRLLKLSGMLHPAERLPVPDTPTPEPAVGKKEQANRDAQTAHQGTSWSQILN